MLTLNQILDQISDLGTAHYQIASVGTGTIAEWQAEPDRSYPLLWIFHENSQITDAYLTHNIRLIVADRVITGEDGEDTDGHEQEVLSDTLSVLADFLNYFQQQHNQEYTVEKNALFEPFTERTNDRVAGNSVVIQINQFYDWNKCVIPESGASIPPTVDGITLYDFCDASVRARLTSAQIVCLTDALCGVCEDATVTNTSGTYSQDVASGGSLVVPVSAISANGDAVANVPATEALDIDVEYETQGEVDTSISAGKIIVPDVPPPSPYVLPDGFLEFEEFTGNEIRLRMAVYDAPMNAIALRCSVNIGDVNYAWGDGDTDVVASNVNAEHIYDWADADPSTFVETRNHRQQWLIITPNTPGAYFNSYGININQNHSVTGYYSRIITGLGISGSLINSQPVFSGNGNHQMNEEFYFYGSNAITSGYLMFSGTSIMKVGALDHSNMTNVSFMYYVMKRLLELPASIDISNATVSDRFISNTGGGRLLVNLTDYGQDTSLQLLSYGGNDTIIDLVVDDNESAHVTSLAFFAFGTILAKFPDFSDTSNVGDWRNAFPLCLDGVVPNWDMSGATLTGSMFNTGRIQKVLAHSFTCDMDFSDQLLTSDEQDRILDNAGDGGGTSTLDLSGNPESTSAYAIALAATKNWILIVTP